MTDEIWMGLVHVVPGLDEGPWVDSFGVAEGGYTWALALAQDEQDFRDTVTGMIGGEGWIVSDFDDVSRFSATGKRGQAPAGIETALHDLEKSGDPQFTAFYLYRRPDFAPDESWSELFSDGDASELQLDMARNLQDMTQELQLSLLVGISVVTHDDAVEFILHHAEDDGFDLSVEVAPQGAVTVDYSVGHVHFSEEDGHDWHDHALSFIASALQGGVRVDIWDKKGEIAASRTWILADGEWVEYSTSIHDRSARYRKLKHRPPAASHHISFLSPT